MVSISRHHHAIVMKLCIATTPLCIAADDWSIPSGVPAAHDPTFLGWPPRCSIAAATMCDRVRERGATIVHRGWCVADCSRW
ncbi:MAG: hypothetical protein KGS47_04805 [Chloroflexi bacterium]|nr:hypothetical protein [Chloroflexota bacterium]